MFYYLSKLFWLVVSPLNLAILLALIGSLLFLFQRRRLASLTMGVSIAILVVGGWTNIGMLMLEPLEQRFSQPSEPPQDIAGIIVLGGAFDLNVSLRRGNTELVSSSDRYTEALILARHYPDVPIVFTGGTGSLSNTGEKEAFIAERFFEKFGIAQERLIIEADSRTTHENALLTSQLIDTAPGRPWLLVTSAFHMPRSVGVFRQAGYDIIPWPVDYRVGGPGFFLSLETQTGNLEKLGMAMKEWIGLVAYNLTGRTDAIFPG